MPQAEPPRRRLPDERPSITHHFSISTVEEEKDFYVTCGMHDDGDLGEVFITTDKEGSLLRSALDALATAISIGLQYGIPLVVYTRKLEHMKFEPCGRVKGAPVGLSGDRLVLADSPFDYLAKWLMYMFPEGSLRQDCRVKYLQGETR